MKLASAAAVVLAFASLAPVRGAPESSHVPVAIADLGTLGGPGSIALAVNDRRQVIGLSEVSPSGDIHSFLWEDGVMRDLSAAPVRFDGVQDINDRGQIAGAIFDASFNTTAAIWDDGRVTALAIPSGATGCAGLAINDHADAAGLCFFAASPTAGVVWTRTGRILIVGAMPGVGPFVPNAISNDGTVVGYVSAPTGFGGGFAWKNGAIVRLDPFLAAEDVNDHAQIVGWGQPGGLVTALLFDRRRLTALPALFAGANSQAFAINHHGEIAGMSAGAPVVWSRGRPHILPVLPGGLFAITTDINDRGDVVGYATTPVEGFTHATLWPRATPHESDTAID